VLLKAKGCSGTILSALVLTLSSSPLETIMNWEDRITIDPRVLTGKPVVRGTRIAVEFVVEFLSEGWSEQQILDNYPGLSHEDLLACLRYASKVLKSERIYLVPQ
jgi:uncharacterized protein (DUF433 family)